MPCLALTYDRVFCLVALALEVQIVLESVITSLMHCTKNNLHIEFSPSFFFNPEWRLFEDWPQAALVVAEGLMDGDSFILCFGLSKEGWRLYTAFSKTLASTSCPCSSSRHISILHERIGKPSIGDGSSLFGESQQQVHRKIKT